MSKTLICKLWNFKMLTLDFERDFARCSSKTSTKCSDSSQSKEDTLLLDDLKAVIGEKIQRMLFLEGRTPLKALPCDLFRLVQGGKDLGSLRDLKVDETLYVELRGSLKGGKGGFGSLLRSVKPKAQQDDNYEACRDLSGRRLRHINNERRIREFHQRQEEEEKYV